MPARAMPADAPRTHCIQGVLYTSDMVNNAAETASNINVRLTLAFIGAIYVFFLLKIRIFAPQKLRRIH
jgi:hypothetical protein